MTKEDRGPDQVALMQLMIPLTSTPQRTSYGNVMHTLEADCQWRSILFSLSTYSTPIFRAVFALLISVRHSQTEPRDFIGRFVTAVGLWRPAAPQFVSTSQGKAEVRPSAASGITSSSPFDGISGWAQPQQEPETPREDRDAAHVSAPVDSHKVLTDYIGGQNVLSAQIHD